MLTTLFNGLFDSDLTQVISVTDFLICLASALIVGLLMALSYMYRSRYTKSFAVALALLPAAVCIVILMVNGNIGTGVAIAGAFSLVRFRSAQGSAREICALFLAMGAGLVVGMGYIAYAVLFTVIMGTIFMLYNRLNFGNHKSQEKVFTITIPENLDYTNVFQDLFDAYAKNVTLVRVKTTNLGSMFRLTYHITLIDPAKEKEFVDQLRCRNGNLEISVSLQDTGAVAEL